MWDGARYYRCVCTMDGICLQIVWEFWVEIRSRLVCWMWGFIREKKHRTHSLMVHLPNRYQWNQENEMSAHVQQYISKSNNLWRNISSNTTKARDGGEPIFGESDDWSCQLQLLSSLGDCLPPYLPLMSVTFCKIITHHIKTFMGGFCLFCVCCQFHETNIGPNFKIKYSS